MASGGARSLLAPWIGGAGSPQPSGGYRSLLAFWMGGAANLGTPTPPTPPEPPRPGGGGGAAPSEDYEPKRRKPIRGRADGELARLMAAGSGAVGVAGFAAGELEALQAAGLAVHGVAGEAYCLIAPLTAEGQGRYYDFTDDEILAVILAAVER